MVQIVQLVANNVKSKLSDGFIDTLLLAQMQLLASLIRHCDKGPPKDPNSTDVSIFELAVRQEICIEICPRLLTLANRALGARLADINVSLAEAGVVETEGVLDGDFQASYHIKASK